MSILNNEIRIGNFTSSEIVEITKMDRSGKNFGKAAMTYINKKNMERRLGRPLTSESNAKPLLWGLALENICFQRLGMDYTLCSQDTIQHPRHSFWAGSADCIKHDEGKTLPDLKCPFTLESFCNMVQPLYDGLTGIDAMNWVRENHSDGEKFYWQLLSNSILHGTKYVELVIFMPYLSELEEVRQSVEGDPKYYWLYNAIEGELPFLPDGGFYKNVNIIRFQPPDEDKSFLFSQVLKASELLITKPIKP